MKKIAFVFLTLIICPLFIISAIAQPPPPPPQPIPIDGGLFFLLIGGAVFAAKKFYKKYDKQDPK